jgi:hypothetical protein
MNLLKSLTGIPYIEFDEKTRLIFSGVAETEYGYKYFAFQGKNFVSIKIKQKEGYVYGDVHETVSFVTDMGLSAIPPEGKINEYVQDNFPRLRQTLSKYVNGDGYFPKAKMDEFMQEIVSLPVITDKGKASIIGKKRGRAKKAESTETMTLSSGVVVNVKERVNVKEENKNGGKKMKKEKKAKATKTAKTEPVKNVADAGNLLTKQGTATKECFKCKTEKATTEFYSAPASKTGFSSWCKDCLKNRGKK